MCRVLLFMGAFGVFLVRCRCFLVTQLHLRGCLVVIFQHVSYVFFDEVSCYVCVQLGIFSRSYYVLLFMGFLARSVLWRCGCVCCKPCLSVYPPYSSVLSLRLPTTCSLLLVADTKCCLLIQNLR
jgi:hypothetical protein